MSERLTATPAGVALGPLDLVADGGARGFDPQGRGQDTMLVVRRGERVFGWHDACPHYGGTPMAWRKDAYLDAAGTRIVCAAHGAQFDIESGLCTLGPCLGQRLDPVALAVTGARTIHIRADGAKET